MFSTGCIILSSVLISRQFLATTRINDGSRDLREVLFDPNRDPREGERVIDPRLIRQAHPGKGKFIVLLGVISCSLCAVRHVQPKEVSSQLGVPVIAVSSPEVIPSARREDFQPLILIKHAELMHLNMPWDGRAVVINQKGEFLTGEQADEAPAATLRRARKE